MITEFKKRSRGLKNILFSILICCVVMPSVGLAYKTEVISGLNPNHEDFVVGPGKTEVTLDPGEKRTVNIIVTNRLGDDKTFQLEVEDFTGSKNVEQTVVLLGDDRGPYSLKDYLSFEEPKFDLRNGERATIPVTISIPHDAEPGGLYGSVLVSVVSSSAEDGTNSGARGGSVIVSRIGTLFFVRIPGDVKTEGSLKEFKIAKDKTFFSEGPIDFQLFYENTGSINVNPYGEIAIENILGEEVGFVEIEPWFAMPNSLRLREVSWNRGLLFGQYTATAQINRGYDDIIDTKTLSFYVLPWKVALGGFAIIAFLFLFVRWIISRFEFKVRKKG
ncbi:MAG: hypothetical protein KAI72_05890 [Candidatus Pacebacteria bacterium]|nr:hypothetical protein [Candidatus Paceibacterota bacterium]